MVATAVLCRISMDQLKNVQQIQASTHALAVILGHGFVVTWAHAVLGGVAGAVRHRLANVQQIHTAFAAILGDGSVVTWVIDQLGGDSSYVQGQLRNVQQNKDYKFRNRKNNLSSQP